MKPSDEDLMARLPDSAGTLTERYWPSAFRVARGLGLDEAAAQDAAQDAFVRLLERPTGYGVGRRFKPWFFQIVRNQARQRLRSERRREARELKRARPERSEQPGYDDRHEAVREALGRLKPTHREVLSLHYLAGLTLAEVAQTTGVPKGTVDSQLHRGLKALRGSLAPTHALSVPLLVELLRGGVFSVPPTPAGLLRTAPRLGPALGLALVAALAVAALVVPQLSSAPTPPATDGPLAGGRAEEPAHDGADSVSPVGSPRGPVSQIPAALDGLQTGGPNAPPAEAEEEQATAAEQAEAGSVMLHSRSADPDQVLVLRFRDASGTPVAGVRAYLERDSHSAYGAYGRTRRNSGPSSGSDGVLRIVGVGAGDYFLSHYRSGYLDERFSFSKPSLEPSYDLAVELSASVPLEVTFLDGAGAPLAGVAVRTASRTLLTDATGTVRHDQVPQGLPLTLQLRRGAHVHEVEVTPEGAPLVLSVTDLPEPVQVAVTIPFRQHGEWPAETEVWIFGQASEFVYHKTLATDALEGGLRLELAPDRYEVNAFPAGRSGTLVGAGATCVVPEGVHAYVTPEVVLKIEESKIPAPPGITAQPAFTLVVRGPAHKPLRWGQATSIPRVDFFHEQTWKQATVELDGDPVLEALGFEFEDPKLEEEFGELREVVSLAGSIEVEVVRLKVSGLPAGGARARLFVAGHAPQELGLLVPGAAPDVTLLEGGQVEVRVQRLDGTPREGVQLVLGEASLSAVTNAAGVARWAHVSPGLVRVSLKSRPEEAVAQLQVEDRRLARAEVTVAD